LAYLRDGSLYFLSGVTLPAPGIESAHCKPSLHKHKKLTK